MNDLAQVEDEQFDDETPEVEEKVDLVAIAIQGAFEEAISNESDEDDTKLQMISAGATFKNVTRLYNQYMIDAGLAISKADRNQIVGDTLEGLEFDTEENFGAATTALQEAIEGSTERSVAALVRAYAKKNELECYTKPKGEGGTRTSFASKFYDALVANPLMSEEDATAIVMGTGENEETSENVKRHHSHYMNIYGLANSIGKAQAA
jgi:hypothetical protein